MQTNQDQRPSQRALNRKPSRLSIAKSLSGAPHNGNKGFNIVNHNELGEQLFLRVIEANGRPKIVPLPQGGTASVKLPTSRSMQDPGTKESLRRSPVKYIALRIGSAEVMSAIHMFQGLGFRVVLMYLKLPENLSKLTFQYSFVTQFLLTPQFTHPNWRFFTILSLFSSQHLSGG